MNNSTNTLGESFAKSIGLYLQKGFQKGIPSLFQSVKSLYATSEKVCCSSRKKKHRRIEMYLGTNHRFTAE
jgi:hypothetical protein